MTKKLYKEGSKTEQKKEKNNNKIYNSNITTTTTKTTTNNPTNITPNSTKLDLNLEDFKNNHSNQCLEQQKV